MNLISKQEAIEAFSDMCDGTPVTHGDMISDTSAVNVIKSIPSAFDGKTNGDVLATIYPDHEAERVGLSMVLRPKGKKGIGDTHILVDLDFWNAPYQKGGEEE